MALRDTLEGSSTSSKTDQKARAEFFREAEAITEQHYGRRGRGGDTWVMSFRLIPASKNDLLLQRQIWGALSLLERQHGEKGDTVAL